MDVIMEFATPIGMFYSEEDLGLRTYNSVLKIVENENEDNFTYRSISKTTPDNLHLREEFSDFLKFIEDKTKKFAEDVLGVKMSDLAMSGMWSNVHKPGSKHHNHQHPNSFISGVFYPFCPDCEDIGNIIFIDPRQAKNMVHADFFKSSCISNRNIWVTPKSGLLLIFPSWLEHGTDPFIGNTEDRRVAISFNYQLKKCDQKTMRIYE